MTIYRVIEVNPEVICAVFGLFFHTPLRPLFAQPCATRAQRFNSFSLRRLFNQQQRILPCMFQGRAAHVAGGFYTERAIICFPALCQYLRALSLFPALISLCHALLLTNQITQRLLYYNQHSAWVFTRSFVLFRVLLISVYNTSLDCHLINLYLFILPAAQHIFSRFKDSKGALSYIVVSHA